MTKIFAHRGSAGTHPENTMIAFYEAERVEADGIELDVQMTKDGALVVIHDETIDRTTDGTGWVKDFIYKELQQFNAVYKFAEQYDFCRIPLLEEVLQWIEPTELLLNIELKNGLIEYKKLEEKVIDMVRHYHLEHRVVLSSFNHNSMALCHRLAPEIETAILYMKSLCQPWKYMRAIGASGLHPYHGTVTESFVRQAHDHRVAVRPFTINKAGLMKKMFQYQVDAIFTDYPSKAKQLLNNQKTT
ncbi:glycerophosphodiester phosphodiesterase [Thermaerobacillus caldiproteolyticus]|uniref:Glycerophosphoryl diester phosphodiesterase n=1 Tax=Thermaerobacillus caldiproteolyticus TaxID=247480 RepID=A0A7V9Z3I4_9BACL|nr:glycerophosphodiester phosphodiesterase [Anoxybacillus caldiproteolyticus]MBA2873392.1 glycerophosphoryl diester phosphodiesterase [Anoxybacillus caldiproteolyticus]QPA29986.1 glycerophosphodiester phosphodiesterase [Anoxybacillus caldiproteolyticus]